MQKVFSRFLSLINQKCLCFCFFWGGFNLMPTTGSISWIYFEVFHLSVESNDYPEILHKK